MDEGAPKGSRPNEGLPLNENRPGDEGPKFYYSRERRLARAPASVQALYGEQEKPKFSLLRPLLASRSNAILFGTMAALILITLVISFSGLWDGQDFYGNRISLSAVRYDGAAVVILKKTLRGEAYTGPLYISVSPLGGDSESPYPYRVVLSARQTEEFRFSVPFEEKELLIELSAAPEKAEKEGGLAFRVKTK
ncbi:MAG: hypothetical protein LBQ46_03190 [Treponema sp.]|jgi:hypothetical protein|nr:hypothetical protein [Treponema sp.]